MLNLNPVRISGEGPAQRVKVLQGTLEDLLEKGGQVACTCSSEPFKVGLGAYGDLGLPELGEENPASPNQIAKVKP